VPSGLVPIQLGTETIWMQVGTIDQAAASARAPGFNVVPASTSSRS
jgi:hypothetical protein